MKAFFSKCDQIRSFLTFTEEFTDLVTFTEEIINGRHFILCSEKAFISKLLRNENIKI